MDLTQLDLGEKRRAAFYAAHAHTCQQLDTHPGLLPQCRTIEISGRIITDEQLGFFPAAEVVLDRSEGPQARAARSYNLVDLDRDRADSLARIAKLMGPQVVSFVP